MSVGVRVTVNVGDNVGVRVGDIVTVTVNVGVRVGDIVTVRVGVKVNVGVSVLVNVGDKVTVNVGVSVGDNVGDKVGVGDSVGVSVSVYVASFKMNELGFSENVDGSNHTDRVVSFATGVLANSPVAIVAPAGEHGSAHISKLDVVPVNQIALLAGKANRTPLESGFAKSVGVRATTTCGSIHDLAVLVAVGVLVLVGVAVAVLVAVGDKVGVFVNVGVRVTVKVGVGEYIDKNKQLSCVSYVLTENHTLPGV